MAQEKNYKKYISRNQIYVPCKTKETDCLVEVSQNISATNNATTQSTFTIPTGRGEVLAIRPLAGSVTVADLAQCLFTLQANGMSIYENVPLTDFYLNSQNSRSYRNIVIPEKATMTAIVVNGSSNTIPFSVVYYFQDPYLDCQ